MATLELKSKKTMPKLCAHSAAADHLKVRPPKVVKSSKKILKQSTVTAAQPGSVSESCSSIFASFPRDIIAYDLMVQCAESGGEEEQEHLHRAHTFPLYLLSPFFIKAISFASQGHRRHFLDMKE